MGGNSREALVPSLGCKLHLLMPNENSNIPKNETFRWLEPGAWRKPCIVHGTGRGVVMDY